MNLWDSLPNVKQAGIKPHSRLSERTRNAMDIVLFAAAIALLSGAAAYLWNAGLREIGVNRWG